MPRLCVDIEPALFQCEYHSYYVSFAILAAIRELIYSSIEHKSQRADPGSHRLYEVNDCRKDVGHFYIYGLYTTNAKSSREGYVLHRDAPFVTSLGKFLT